MSNDFQLMTYCDAGLYCPAGDFYIDPVNPVSRAVVTHAHTDHARRGHDEYICSRPSEALIERRAIDNSEEQSLRSVPYNESFSLRDVEVSFHPAGHLLGSAQVRVSDGNEVWVFTGDYKRNPDPTCEDFESVDCDVFITEVTYGLPVYRWKESTVIFDKIAQWLERNRSQGQASILFGYSLGKAQRLLAGLDTIVEDPVLVHGALMDYNEIYRDHGISLADTKYATELPRSRDYGGDLVMAPPSAYQSEWMSRFNDPSTAFASGWMQIRGIKRRRGYDRGFTLSDHCDWPGLLQTVEEVSPEVVYTMHGDTDSFCRYLREEKNIEARELESLGANGYE